MHKTDGPRRQHSFSIRGFTIVELLIVIVVIGILAAITLVAYNGIQNRAKQSAAQSASSQASKKLQTYFLTNADTYPPDLATAGITNSGDTTFQYSYNNSVNPKTYCITTTTNTISYYQNNTTQPSPAPGGCPGHGVGGVAAVTNLVTNPSAEANVSEWSAQNASLTTSNTWASSGSNSFMLTSTGSASSDMRIGGVSTFALGMQAGNTYLISATVRLVASQTGSLSSRARAINFGISTDGSTYGTTLVSSQAPNSAGVTQLSLLVPIPSNATGVLLYLGNGSNSVADVVWWDSIMATLGTDFYNYADGSSPNWVWNGTPNASTSTGPPL